MAHEVLLPPSSFGEPIRLRKGTRNWAYPMARKQNGFSLIELLIVVAIILIIAAIAIPNLMSGRMAANEASAVQSLRTIQSSETAYATTYPIIGFSATLADLGDGGTSACSASSAQACLIDAVLASGNKNGYIITW